MPPGLGDGEVGVEEEDPGDAAAVVVDRRRLPTPNERRDLDAREREGLRSSVACRAGM